MGPLSDGLIMASHPSQMILVFGKVSMQHDIRPVNPIDLNHNLKGDDKIR